MSFPTLKRKASSVNATAIDNTIVSKSDAGYVQARPRYTRKRMSFTSVTYILDDEDYVLIDAHDASVGTSGIFSWTYPVTNVTYQVRYSKRLSDTPINIGGKFLHQVTFDLESV